MATISLRFRASACACGLPVAMRQVPGRCGSSARPASYIPGQRPKIPDMAVFSPVASQAACVKSVSLALDGKHFASKSESDILRANWAYNYSPSLRMELLFLASISSNLSDICSSLTRFSSAFDSFTHWARYVSTCLYSACTKHMIWHMVMASLGGVYFSSSWRQTQVPQTQPLYYFDRVCVYCNTT